VIILITHIGCFGLCIIKIRAAVMFDHIYDVVLSIYIYIYEELKEATDTQTHTHTYIRQ